MSRLRINIAANYVGSGYAGLLSLLLVPFYLRILGPEAFGLVGLFASLRALIGVLDLGLSATTGREIAARVARPDGCVSIARLVRTIEIAYWLIGLVAATSIYLASELIASRWLQTDRLSKDTLTLVVGIFGASLAASWTVSFYKGVLRGLERQVTQNAVAIVAATVRGLGALGVLLWVSPTITAFFLWQLVASVIEVSMAAVYAWRMVNMESGGRGLAAFDLVELRRIWKLAAGISGVSVLALIVTQIDKLYISTLLPLSQLGYYTVAGSLVSVVVVLVGPVTAAVFPRFTTALAAQDIRMLSKTYHRATKFVAFLVAPVGGALLFFGHDLLFLWTRSAEVADNGYLTVAFLAVGSMLSSVAVMPYALQLAAGFAWMPLLLNAVSAVLLIPALYLAVTTWGAVGAAAAMMANNIFYFLAAPQLTHRYVLKGHQRTWILGDTLPFVTLSFAAFGFARILGSELPQAEPWRLLLLVCGAGIYFGVSYWRHKDVVHQGVNSVFVRQRAA